MYLYGPNLLGQGQFVTAGHVISCNMPNITCDMSHNLSCGTVLFNKMMSFVSTGYFMNRATLSYVMAENFTIRHKMLIIKTTKPNQTSVLNFNIKII